MEQRRGAGGSALWEALHAWSDARHMGRGRGGGGPRGDGLRRRRRRRRRRQRRRRVRSAQFLLGDPQNPLEPSNTNEVQGGKVLDMIFRG